MLADKTTIENYIPQRRPMVMIDCLTKATDECAVSEFTIEPDNIFVSEGLFTEFGLIENIAQTAAAQAGYLHQQQGIPITQGFIAAIKNVTILTLPPLHSKIKTTVTVTNRIFEVVIIQGTVEHNDITLCHCEMKIFIKSQKQFL